MGSHAQPCAKVACSTVSATDPAGAAADALDFLAIGAPFNAGGAEVNPLALQITGTYDLSEQRSLNPCTPFAKRVLGECAPYPWRCCMLHDSRRWPRRETQEHHLRGGVCGPMIAIALDLPFTVGCAPATLCAELELEEAAAAPPTDFDLPLPTINKSRGSEPNMGLSSKSSSSSALPLATTGPAPPPLAAAEPPPPTFSQISVDHRHRPREFGTSGAAGGGQAGAPT